jgi:ABC-2 type transport system permease protein
MSGAFRLSLGLELRRSRAATIWLAMIAILYAGIVTDMYPIIQRNSALIEQYMSMFPKGFAEAFGMTGSLAAPGVFFGTYVSMFLWPVLAAIAAILVSTRVFAADVDRGWGEIPLSTPLSRTTLALASITGQAILTAVLTVATVAPVVFVGAMVGADFAVGPFALAGIVLFLFGCAVCAVTSFISTVTLSRGTAGGLIAALLLTMYLFQVIAQMNPDLGILGDLSAFRHLSTSNVIDRGASPLGSSLVFGVVTLLGWGGTVLVFRRRDLIA